MARIVILLFAVLGVAAGDDRELVRIQREIALLGQSVDSLQLSVDERLASMLTLVEETLARVKENAAASSGIQERLRESEQGADAGLEAIAREVKQMTDSYADVRDALAGVDARLRLLETSIERLEESVRIMQAPAPPPPLESESGA
jgi:chromosome segregation ATPase